MNALIIFAAAVMVALILERQELILDRKLRIVAVMAGLKLGERPGRRVPLALALVNVLVGFLLSALGLAMLVRMLQEPDTKLLLQESAALLVSIGIVAILTGMQELRGRWGVPTQRSSSFPSTGG